MFNSFSVTGCSLELLKTGERGIIKFCKSKDEQILNQVVSMGLTPGTLVSLEQRFPFFVIKVGRKFWVLDPEIARVIYVRVVNC